jgi:transposase
MGEALATVELLEPGQRTLRELANEARKEHFLATQAGVEMVEHAIRAGSALLCAQAQIEPGNWCRWLEQSEWPASRSLATSYMQIAHEQEAVRASGAQSIVAAKQHLIAMGTPGRPSRLKYPDWVKDEAVRLVMDGKSVASVSRELGVSRPIISDWINPGAAKARQAKRLAAIRRRKELERERAIKKAVRKAGAAVQEAWAMAERMQDVLAQAQRETEDRDARRALSEAGIHYRKMRDEIVRALGVQ